jgi:hypothetical protein
MRIRERKRESERERERERERDPLFYQILVLTRNRRMQVTKQKHAMMEVNTFPLTSL